MLDKFKEFVKSNPKLIKYKEDNNKTWQDLYEIYVLYGEDKEIWNNYLKKSDLGIEELISMIKGINLDTVKNTVDNLQKAVSIIQSIGNKSNNNEQYEQTKKYENLDD